MAHSEEVKQEAIARALVGDSYQEICDDLGIGSRGTISKWLRAHEEALAGNGKPVSTPNSETETETETKEETKQTETAARKNLRPELDRERVAENLEREVYEAQARIAHEIEQKQAKLSNALFGLTILASKRIEEALKQGENPDRRDAKWLYRLTGTLDYLIRNAQLLTGGPTERGEVRVENARTSRQQLFSRIRGIASRTETDGSS